MCFLSYDWLCHPFLNVYRDFNTRRQLLCLAQKWPQINECCFQRQNQEKLSKQVVSGSGQVPQEAGESGTKGSSDCAIPLDLRTMGERKRSTMRHLITWRIFTGHQPYVRPCAWRWKYGNPNRAAVLGASSNPRERWTLHQKLHIFTNREDKSGWIAWQWNKNEEAEQESDFPKAMQVDELGQPTVRSTVSKVTWDPASSVGSAP